jgi:hypothetical protein
VVGRLSEAVRALSGAGGVGAWRILGSTAWLSAKKIDYHGFSGVSKISTRYRSFQRNNAGVALAALSGGQQFPVTEADPEGLEK